MDRPQGFRAAQMADVEAEPKRVRLDQGASTADLRPQAKCL